MITQTNVQRECVIIQRDNFGMKVNEITFKAKRSGLETFVEKSRDFICWLGHTLKQMDSNTQESRIEFTK